MVLIPTVIPKDKEQAGRGTLRRGLFLMHEIDLKRKEF